MLETEDGTLRVGLDCLLCCDYSLAAWVGRGDAISVSLCSGTTVEKAFVCGSVRSDWLVELVREILINFQKYIGTAIDKLL